jgi:hypothetical protein
VSQHNEKRGTKQKNSINTHSRYLKKNFFVLF